MSQTGLLQKILKYCFLLSFLVVFSCKMQFMDVDTPQNVGKIAFQNDVNGNYEIYVMNADGSNVQRLTTNGAVDNTPQWCPAR